MATRREYPAIVVRQWLKGWDAVEFKPKEHRRKPEPFFFVFAMPARTLRRLTGIYRRVTDEVMPRAQDLGIQRRHEQERSDEIAQFVQYGYPWSDLTPAKRSEEAFADLRKPGWLPTAIVVNIIKPGDHRGSRTMTAEDAVTVVQTSGDDIVQVRLPASYRAKWEPNVRPFEVIDGQHRLWAFADAEGDDEFEVPVVAFHGLDVSWQAYLFWTINIKPKRINPSLAFDLYPLLRTEDWLERFTGHPIYRETRAQELVEAMWSHPESPWRERIDMLGVHPRQQVSQAAWVRSLLATFVKAWEGRRSPIGGLFGAPVGGDETVLPWDRAQQAAFLIMLWREFRDAVRESRAGWAQSLRNGPRISDDDPAFFGRHALISTDQGVRGVLAIANDFFFLKADDLGLSEWGTTVAGGAAATDEERVKRDLASLTRHSAAAFWRDVAQALTKYDWRTSAFPELTRSEQTTKAALRGAGGYRELRLQLLDTLLRESGEIRQVATKVRATLT